LGEHDESDGSLFFRSKNEDAELRSKVHWA
jgi:hypothetical protein